MLVFGFMLALCYSQEWETIKANPVNVATQSTVALMVWWATSKSRSWSSPLSLISKTIYYIVFVYFSWWQRNCEKKIKLPWSLSLMAEVCGVLKTIRCNRGANQRQRLLQDSVDIYNSGAKVINCWRIIGCSVDAVQVIGGRSAFLNTRAVWGLHLCRLDTSTLESTRYVATASFSYNKPTFSLSN